MVVDVFQAWSTIAFSIEVADPDRQRHEADIHLRIGEPNFVLDAWMARQNLFQLAIVTSTDPGGVRQSPSVNASRWTDLMMTLEGSHRRPTLLSGEPRYRFCRATSRPGCGGAAFEQHAAVLGMGVDQAAALATIYGQVAFVHVDRRVRPAGGGVLAVPRIVLATGKESP